MQETKLKPATRYIAKAIAYRDGFRAQFAIPGHVPDYVRENGKIQEFSFAPDAEMAAARVAIQMANDRLALPVKFEKAAAMTAEELSNLLHEIELSPTEAVHLLQNEHVMSWLGGDRRVPHMARIILTLMRDIDIDDKVEAITAEAIEKGKLV